MEEMAAAAWPWEAAPTGSGERREWLAILLISTGAYDLTNTNFFPAPIDFLLEFGNQGLSCGERSTFF